MSFLRSIFKNQGEKTYSPEKLLKMSTKSLLKGEPLMYCKAFKFGTVVKCSRCNFSSHGDRWVNSKGGIGYIQCPDCDHIFGMLPNIKH
jgi:hypothetical protein